MPKLIDNFTSLLKTRVAIVLSGMAVLWLLFSSVALANGHPIDVFVSILPQKYFVNQVCGDKVEVHVMVGPGQSPETYEPSPRQMEKLSHAAIYFRMGMPFENTWMSRIKSLNPHLIIVDAREGVKLLDMSDDDIFLTTSAPGLSHDHGMKDPHIWTNPVNVAIFMEHFTARLAALYPQDKSFYENNYHRFAAQLTDLDERIKTLFEPIHKKYLLVYHPSWGYFAQRYGLKQLPIEIEGKAPNAKSLAEIINFAKQNNLRTVFTQKQFSQRDAQAVANAIGGKVVAVDPLAEDYMHNMMDVARQFARSMENE